MRASVGFGIFVMVLSLGTSGGGSCGACSKFSSQKSPDFMVDLASQKDGQFWEREGVPLSITDKGTIGHTFEISEEDLLSVISLKLRKWETQGKLTLMNQEIQKKVAKSLNRPTPVAGLQKTETPRKRTFDPTFMVPEDVKGPDGKILHERGKKINPLTYVSFGEPLIFLDGDDLEQVKFFQNEPGKIVLVKGSPLEVSQTIGKEVYFDQGGSLVQKLKITHVPSLVFQEGDYLVIQEKPTWGPA